MKPPERSSWCTWTSRRASAARASAIGVDRDPGQTTAWRTPERTHSSTNVAQKVALTSPTLVPPVAGSLAVIGPSATRAAYGPTGTAPRTGVGPYASQPWSPAGCTSNASAPSRRPTGQVGGSCWSTASPRPHGAGAPSVRPSPPITTPGPSTRPGHGGSSAVRADLVEGAALLGAAGGRATYIGYSMGGRLALHLALGRPDLVERLVLIGATPGLEDDGARAARRAADDALADHLEISRGRRVPRRVAGTTLVRRALTPSAAELGERRRNTAAGLASSLRLAGTGTQRPLWDDLGRLTMPVLLVAGAEDHKFHDLAERMSEHIGPTATVTVIADAGHTAHLEQPAETARLVRAWLTSHPGH